MKNLAKFEKEEKISTCIVGGEGIETITNDNGCGEAGADWYVDGEMYY